MKMTVSTRITALLVCTMALENAKAQDIKPYKAEEIRVYQGKPVEQNGNVKKDTSLTEGTQNLSDFFALYSYWVPGTAYNVPDYTNRREVVKVSAGTGVLPGSLRIDANGSYIWNSSWDGKIIKGRWRRTGDSDYPIELLMAQEGKNWRVGKSKDAGVAIHIWDGSTWYNGKKINASR